MFARQVDLPIQTHLAETRDEVASERATSGGSPLVRLDRLGATGPGFIAIHAVHVDAADIAVLAAQGCHVVHCPTSNMKLASGIAPVAAMFAAGINVALGTDGAASNNRLDVFSEMRLASLLAKVAGDDAAAVPAAVALRMATLNGARALGMDDRIGSLVPGKQADIVAVDLSGIATQPVFDPLSHLVFAAGRECVTDVWIGGVRMVADRRLTTIDEAALLARTRAWQHKLAAHTSRPDERRSLQRRPQRRSGRTRQVLRRRAPLVGPDSEFRPLHEINPVRLDWIEDATGGIAGKRVLDVGCGGGILAESMAAHGALVTGIDLAEKALGVAQLHGLESGVARRLSPGRGRGVRGRSGRGSSTSSHAWKCWSTCPTRRRSSPRARRCAAGRHRHLRDDQPQPQVLPASRSSARNTCCSCCRAERTTGRSSCDRRSSRDLRGAPASNSPR